MELATRARLYAVSAATSRGTQRCSPGVSKAPTRVGVLGSTRGSSLQPVLDAIAAGKLNAQIVVVASNKADAIILQRAANHNIDAVHVSNKGKKREEFDRDVHKVLQDHGVELVLLVGYMRILSDWFVDQWRGRNLNVHPSLLPDFAGGMDLAVHQAVIEAGRKESGCTVHLVTEEVDGGQAVVQKRCPVLVNDTPETLKARVQPLEGVAFIEAIQTFHNEGGFGSE